MRIRMGGVLLFLGMVVFTVPFDTFAQEGACDVLPLGWTSQKRKKAKKVRKHRARQRAKKKSSTHTHKKKLRSRPPVRRSAVGTSAYEIEVMRRLILRKRASSRLSIRGKRCGLPMDFTEGDADCVDVRHAWRSFLGYKALRRCYENSLKSRSLSGSVKLRITLRRSGQVKRVEHRGGTLREKQMIRCLLRVLRDFTTRPLLGKRLILTPTLRFVSK